MSDPTLSDIDFKNKMAWVWTTLNFISFQGNLVSDRKVTWTGNITDKELEQMYTNWIEYVRSKVPKEKLLEFNVKDGIEKLARFTGKEIPSWKMPNVNDSKEFNQRRQVVYIIAIAIYLRKWSIT